MCKYYDITTPDSAFSFLLEELEFDPEELIVGYRIDCDSDMDLFWEQNKYRFESLDIRDIRFLAFHVTGSLDDCREIKENGIRNLQYVLSNNTMLSRLLKRCGIKFDIEKQIIIIDDLEYNVDYEYYRKNHINTRIEERLEKIAHRLYYDYCVNGFFLNDRIEDYGTQIHERPEFIYKLIELSPKAKELEDFWKKKSTPYKVLFYATIDQMHRITFDLKNDFEYYTEDDYEVIKKWMFMNAIDRAFCDCDERIIYIRDDNYIPPEQIVETVKCL